MPRASAPSVPGRTRSQTSALLANPHGADRSDQPHAALQRFNDCGRMGETGVTGVVAPQNEAAAVLDVRHRATAAGADAADPVGIAGGEGAAPAADIEGD
jgi:hypothetical protein